MKFLFNFVVAATMAMAVVPLASGRMPFPQNKIPTNNRRRSTRRLSKGSKGSSSKGSKKSVGSSSKVETIETSELQQEVSTPSKSSKASVTTSIYNSSGAKSGKASEGTNAGKAYVTILTDSSHVVLITNAPTPQPTNAVTVTPQPTDTTIQSDTSIETFIVDIESSCTGNPCPIEGWCRSAYGTCGPGRIYCNAYSTWTQLCIKTFIVDNESSCTGNPCPIEGWCRSAYGTCGPGRIYCNVYSTWTQLCRTLVPTVISTGTPTTHEPTGSPTRTHEPTDRPTTHKPVDSLTSYEPTRGPMEADQPLFPRVSEDSSANFFSVPKISPEAVDISDSILLDEAGKDDEPLTTLTYTASEKGGGGESTTSEFPIGGYVAIALCMAAFVLVVALVALDARRKSKQQQQQPIDEHHPLYSL